MFGEMILFTWCWLGLLERMVLCATAECWKDVACLEESYNMLKEVRGLVSTKDCQMACVEMDECQYFTFYGGTVVSGQTRNV